MENIQTLQQKRAQFALDKLPKDLNSMAVSFIAGAPAMILTSGLGQTLAFLLSKQERAKEELFDIIKMWLCERETSLFKNVRSKMDFLKALNALEQSDYLRLQRETLKLLEWLKRYARAFGKEEEDD